MEGVDSHGLTSIYRICMTILDHSQRGCDINFVKYVLIRYPWVDLHGVAKKNQFSSTSGNSNAFHAVEIEGDHSSLEMSHLLLSFEMIDEIRWKLLLVSEKRLFLLIVDCVCRWRDDVFRCGSGVARRQSHSFPRQFHVSDAAEKLRHFHLPWDRWGMINNWMQMQLSFFF